MTYAYIRVSSKDQNETRQLVAAQTVGIEKKNIFIDKLSGANFDRPAYKRLLKKLRAGDTLIIKSIDRLGRNYSEILEQWRILTKVKRVAVKVLDMPILSRVDNDLTGRLIADIVLELLSYVAQIERDFIKQRQDNAKSAGQASYKFVAAGNLSDGIAYEDYRADFDGTSEIVRYYFKDNALIKIAAASYKKAPDGKIDGRKCIIRINEFSNQPDRSLLNLPEKVQDVTRRRKT